MRKTIAAVILVATLGTGAAFGYGENVLDNPAIPLILVLVVAALIVGIILAVANYGNKLKSKRLAEQIDTLANEAKAFFTKCGQDEGLTLHVSTSIVLASGEKACLDEPANLYEAKSSRIYSGAGTRIKGIYIGGGGSTSVESLKQIDSGRLTLTTKKIVFTGSMQSRTIEIKDVVSVVPFIDAIQIASKKRGKVQVYMVRNPFIWTGFIETITRGDVAINEVAARPVPAEPEPSEIKFNCPSCGQHIEADPGMSGQQSTCPTCKNSLVVPVG